MRSKDQQWLPDGVAAGKVDIQTDGVANQNLSSSAATYIARIIVEVVDGRKLLLASSVYIETMAVLSTYSSHATAIL